uniref:Uncharacterized protein n=1 Tax=Glossina palpalis gambiensis TaxID=67801 RepID=A0A1B0BZG6_9MUSC
MQHPSLFADKATHSQSGYCHPQFIHQICKITLKKVRGGGGGACSQIKTNMHATTGDLLFRYFPFIFELEINTHLKSNGIVSSYLQSTFEGFDFNLISRNNHNE